MKLKLKVTLLSDICVSDGGVYNSSIDTDVCYDKKGFPYIPGKRIKGCLRECAIELSDWGDSIDVKAVFGEENRAGVSGSVRIGNATLEESGQVNPEDNPILYHPQNILQHYTYIRTQTSVDQETGVADEASLRSIRVAKKGLVFYAPIEIDERYRQEFTRCCAVCKHMGIARTRGLGEVSLEVIEETADSMSNPESLKTAHMDTLRYCIHLEENVICKSVNAGEAQTLDYIEGSKILGLIAERLRAAGEDYISFVEKGALRCSNAYIGVKGMRYVEAPANYFMIKNNMDEYIDDIYYQRNANTGEQLNAMKHCYIHLLSEGSLKRLNVETEERYHHRRPDDKGIGRAASREDNKADFYQMESIINGQDFYGFITGSEEQISKIYDLLSEKTSAHIGYGNSAEYGAVRITVSELGKKNEQRIKTNRILVKLEAPTIVYNEQAFYSVDKRDLILEINKVLGLDESIIPTKTYIKYVTVGGFNVTWNLRKPTIEAFDKGTVLVYSFDSEVEIPLGTMFIGERCIEGYGEINVSELIENATGRYSIVGTEASKTSENATKRMIPKCSLGAALSEELFTQYLEYYVSQTGMNRIDSDSKATISNMLGMCKSYQSIEEVQKSVKERYDVSSESKKEKGNKAVAILKQVESNYEKALTDFCTAFLLEWKPNMETEKKLKMNYLRFHLIGMKYRIRETEIKKGEKK